jgi:Rrf2 family transcriptional regulator, iron-sulfur cluster assembly transcription factor
MIFSKACEYGIRAAVYIAARSLDNKRSSLKAISNEINSPEAFTAKILQLLAKSGIVVSAKGPAGGFEVDVKKMNRVRLVDIVYSIDGGFNDNICVLGLRNCSQKHPCPVHDQYKHIKSNIRAMLNDTTLLEMSTGIREGTTCLRLKRA